MQVTVQPVHKYTFIFFVILVAPLEWAHRCPGLCGLNWKIGQAVPFLFGKDRTCKHGIPQSPSSAGKKASSYNLGIRHGSSHVLRKIGDCTWQTGTNHVWHTGCACLPGAKGCSEKREVSLSPLPCGLQRQCWGGACWDWHWRQSWGGCGSLGSALV